MKLWQIFLVILPVSMIAGVIARYLDINAALQGMIPGLAAVIMANIIYKINA
ncbi:hypothetical protein AAGQ96_04730 [Pantoea sp. MBD-2R]|uniref:hypothetical protein n=1 Tax=Pantoea sp. MBD-2R TaxID=3141540 RepID=UPI0031832DAF